MTDTTSTTAQPEGVKLIEQIASCADDLATPQAIAAEKPLLARIPTRVRGGIYEAGKAFGLIAAAGLAVAGTFEGKTQLYVIAGAGLLLSLSSWISKANLSS